MAVSSSSGGLGSPTGDLVTTVGCRVIGTVAGNDSPDGSRGGEDDDESVAVVAGTLSFLISVASASRSISCGLITTVSEFKPPRVGSGKHSRFDFSQRGQTQLLDLGSERGGGSEEWLKSRAWDIQNS
jgi:hypothetical protein